MYTVFGRHCDVLLGIYGLRCLGHGNQGRRPKWAANTDNLWDTEMGAMKDEGQARPELRIIFGYKSVGYCMCGTKRTAQGARGQRG